MQKGIADYIMAELERLDSIDISNEDATKLEVSRAQAVSEMVKVACESERVRNEKTKIAYDMGFGAKAERLLG